MFKFLHTADIHLDSPLQSLERYEGAPVDELRLATRHALENLVEVAIEERVAFVVISGDLYDRDWRDYNTGLFFVTQVAKLREEGIQVYVITGNHDAANRMTHSLPWPENVHFFSHNEPETLLDDVHGVAFHGQSFLTQHVTDDISSEYPAPRAGYFNIGLLHTSADGRKGHDPYAPCSLANLGAKGYDYWALGHVHTAEVVQTAPHIVFPGNTQGRHVRETGVKGCYVAEVGDDHSVALRFRPTDVARWSVCTLNADEGREAELEEAFFREVVQLIRGSETRGVAVRVRLEADGGAYRRLSMHSDNWRQRFRAIAVDAGGGSVWLEKLQVIRKDDATAPRNPGAGPLGEVQTLLDELRSDGGVLSEMAEELSDLREKIAAELQTGEGCPDPHDPGVIRSVLPEVEALLTGRLLPEGDA